MEKKQLPLIESDASVRVWVNKGLGKVVADKLDKAIEDAAIELSDYEF